jgi:hypothetical protein
MTEKDTGTPPERRIEPLAPPPGRFDEVFRESRRRRYHRAAATCGVAGVFLAGLFGGLMLGGPRAAVVQAIQEASRLVSPPSPSPSGGPDSSSTVASKVPKHGKKHPRTATVTVPLTAPPERIGDTSVRGRVVNAKGEPLPGLYVYPGVNSESGFVPTGLAVTDAQGEYSIPCNGGPVLITPWLLNQQRGATVEGTYGARLVDPPGCGQKDLTTTMTTGAAVEGTIHAPSGCAVTELRVWLWVKGSRAASIRLGELSAGGSYRISGLPSGTSVFGDHGRLTPVTLTAGETTQQDLDLSCPDLSTPLPTPTPTTPTPTPSATSSSSPSPTDPEPSTSTPSGSGSGSAPTPGSGGGSSPTSSTR